MPGSDFRALAFCGNLTPNCPSFRWRYASECRKPVGLNWGESLGIEHPGQGSPTVQDERTP